MKHSHGALWGTLNSVLFVDTRTEIAAGHAEIEWCGIYQGECISSKPSRIPQRASPLLRCMRLDIGVYCIIIDYLLTDN